MWVDCFSRFPLSREDWLRLVEAGFRLCLVSPDLVGRISEAEILDQRRLFAQWAVEPDAVCVKLEMARVWTAPL